MSISVAIYVRLSREDRDKVYKGDDSCSIQNQKSMLTNYCSERNWDIYQIYTDDGYSGIDDNRPEFIRMLKDCEAGAVNVVLCKDQSRFSRKIETVERYINGKFLEWGVRFIGASDNSDSNNEAYNMLRLCNGMMNEIYVQNTSQKVKSVLQHKREQGQFVGSFAPYGYAVDPKNKNHLVIDPDAAENVRLIFDLYVQGNGYRAIAIELNNRGIPSPTIYKQMKGSKYCNKNAEKSASNGFWTLSTITRIIQNETYTGTLVQGKSHSVSYKNHKRKPVPSEEWSRKTDAHEAIIDPETWHKVQDRISKKMRVSKTTQTLLLFSGKLKCAVCDAHMKQHQYWNKAHTIKYHGYRCATYNNGAMNCANAKSISQLQLEAFLIKQINTHIRQFCNTNKLTLLDKHREKVEALTANLNLLNEQIADKENKITKTYEDYLDGTISVEQYKIISNKFSREIEELTAKRDSIQEQLKNIENVKAEEANKKAIINKYLYVDKLTREIVDDFIDTIHIGEYEKGKDRKITIDWKI